MLSRENNFFFFYYNNGVLLRKVLARNVFIPSSVFQFFREAKIQIN